MAVLDLGTGSGILAIAAAKLGASQVLALDINPAAVAVARSNAQANGVSDAVAVTLGTLPKDKTWRRNFDLVVANITAKVIDELAEPLVRSLKPQGILIAGGIIEERLEEVSMRLQKEGARIIGVLSDAEWRTIVAQAGEG
jgi:ribosomal protein L11 methyltransferase